MENKWNYEGWDGWGEKWKEEWNIRILRFLGSEELDMLVWDERLGGICKKKKKILSELKIFFI